MGRNAQPILLAGLSIRMLAELAVRAGYDVVALDYFGDADLRALCPSKSLRRDYGLPYTAANLADVAGQLEAMAVAYTASLENHPDQVARLAQGRQLLGNAPDVLLQVRNPLRLADCLRAGGYRFPETWPASQPPRPESGRRWLWKPWRSGGGHAVRFWRGQQPETEGVFQEWLSGMVGSAAFVANGQTAVLLGITEQLIGQRFAGASGFRYCGNLLPPRLSPDELHALLQELREMVNYLALSFGLRGINGLDFVWHNRQAWPIELNPRPPASIELMDSVYDLRLFDVHVQSFAGHLPDFDLEQALPDSRAAGKTIVYARQAGQVADTSQWPAQGIRDIPYPGETIGRGQPICTVLATADTPAACRAELKAQVARLRTVCFQDSVAS
jgi:uncharacterized protein